MTYIPATIKSQPLSETIITPTTVLVDDTVALVDDPNTLVGSQVTPVADIKVKVTPNSPRGRIVVSR